MSLLIIAIILGIIEGLTEFIPVSSTGHLIIAGQLLSFTGATAETFEIAIQAGAILAVVVLYFSKFLSLLDFKKKGFAGIQGISLLLITSLPAMVLGLGVHNLIKEYLFHPKPVALALLLGGIAILLVERIQKKSEIKNLDQMNWKKALGIGLFQCLSLWPGTSRSASTILGGMILKLDRKTAAEYSFLAAVPVMFAATGFDLIKSLDVLTPSDIPLFGIGTFTAFIAAILAVKFFISWVSTKPLSVFGWYRIALAILVLLVWH